MAARFCYFNFKPNQLQKRTKMKQIYTTEVFNKENYINNAIELNLVINKCCCGSMILYLDKLAVNLKTIENITYNKNNEHQLVLYVYNENRHSIIKANIQDLEEYEDEWVDLIGDIFCYAFVNKEVKY